MAGARCSGFPRKIKVAGINRKPDKFRFITIPRFSRQQMRMAAKIIPKPHQLTKTFKTASKHAEMNKIDRAQD